MCSKIILYHAWIAEFHRKSFSLNEYFLSKIFSKIKVTFKRIFMMWLNIIQNLKNYENHVKILPK